MANQNLFETLSEMCNYNALESDMAEIINAVKLDQKILITGEKQKINFEQLKEKVLQWGLGKNIIVPQNQHRQALKMVSEVGELCDAIILNDKEKQIDGIGDVLVTVIILSEQLGFNPVHCLEVAYNEIKNRTGKTVGGTFIKDKQ